MEDTKRTRPPKSRGLLYTWKQRQHARAFMGPYQMTSQSWEEKWTHTPFQAPRSCLQLKTIVKWQFNFIPRHSYCGKKILLNVGCMPSNDGKQKTNPMAFWEAPCLIMLNQNFSYFIFFLSYLLFLFLFCDIQLCMYFSLWLLFRCFLHLHCQDF